LLGDIAHQIGQRAFVGKVSMDQNSPDYYIEEKSSAIKEIEDFIVTLQSKKVNCTKLKVGLAYLVNLISYFFTQYPNVQPVITPRFAITCSMDLMKNLSQLASKYDVNIQVRKRCLITFM
jgi:guanine deaminase